MDDEIIVMPPLYTTPVTLVITGTSWGTPTAFGFDDEDEDESSALAPVPGSGQG